MGERRQPAGNDRQQPHKPPLIPEGDAGWLGAGVTQTPAGSPSTTEQHSPAAAGPGSSRPGGIGPASRDGGRGYPSPEDGAGVRRVVALHRSLGAPARGGGLRRRRRREVKTYGNVLTAAGFLYGLAGPRPSIREELAARDRLCGWDRSASGACKRPVTPAPPTAGTRARPGSPRPTPSSIRSRAKSAAAALPSPRETPRHGRVGEGRPASRRSRGGQRLVDVSTGGGALVRTGSGRPHVTPDNGGPPFRDVAAAGEGRRGRAALDAHRSSDILATGVRHVLPFHFPAAHARWCGVTERALGRGPSVLGPGRRGRGSVSTVDEVAGSTRASRDHSRPAGCACGAARARGDAAARPRVRTTERGGVVGNLRARGTGGRERAARGSALGRPCPVPRGAGAERACAARFSAAAPAEPAWWCPGCLQHARCQTRRWRSGESWRSEVGNRARVSTPGRLRAGGSSLRGVCASA